ncbi:hypothetical protein B7463_g3266, partial [Scytalidium lignicola]
MPSSLPTQESNGAAAPDGPRRVPLTEGDRKNASYSVPNLQMALEGLHQDGMVILRDIVDPEHCDRVYQHMIADRDRILETRHKGESTYNQGVKSNILQCAPFTKPGLLYDDFYFNPFVIQVMNAYLGEKPKWVMTTGNNALKGTGGLRQPVHKDTRFRHPKCPFLVIANTALVDFTMENGATEFWLGTHAYSDETCQTVISPESIKHDESVKKPQKVGNPACPIRPEAVEARRLIRPPIQATMKKGDVMLRDFRCWHAGMPNNTEQDRIMVAQAWMAPWYPNYEVRMKIPISQAPYFLGKGRKMEVVCDLVTDEEVENFQHWDNFAFDPTHFLDYYNTTTKNYRYPFQY